MGKYNSSTNNIYQELSGALPGGIWSMPAYFNLHLYYGPVGSPIYAFEFKDAKLKTSPVAQTSNAFEYPGATPSISSNGEQNAIVWAAENSSPAVLHAYNAPPSPSSTTPTRPPTAATTSAPATNSSRR